MSKKILSVVLALVLVMSSFVVAAFAANNVSFEDEESTNTQTWALSEPVTTDGVTYTVDVSLTTNYPTGAIEFVIKETDDANVIELDTMATLGDAITYEAEISADPDTGKVVIVPQTTANATLVTATAINGVIAKLTYTYTGTGSAQIAIKNDPKTETNKGGSLIALRMPEANVVDTNVVAGQKVASVGEARTIGSAAADPVLKPVEGSTGFVDETNKYVYGVPAGTTADAFTDYFTVENGSFVMEANDANCDNGTGAILVVKNNDGEVFDRYTLVIFGDVNGDSLIQTPDATDIYIYLADKLPLSDAQKFAADVNADGVIQTPDATDIYIHLADKGDIKPNIWA